MRSLLSYDSLFHQRMGVDLVWSFTFFGIFFINFLLEINSLTPPRALESTILHIIAFGQGQSLRKKQPYVFLI